MPGDIERDDAVLRTAVEDLEGLPPVHLLPAVARGGVAEVVEVGERERVGPLEPEVLQRVEVQRVVKAYAVALPAGPLRVVGEQPPVKVAARPGPQPA